jgi:hypothetical protein
MPEYSIAPLNHQIFLGGRGAFLKIRIQAGFKKPVSSGLPLVWGVLHSPYEYKNYLTLSTLQIASC